MTADLTAYAYDGLGNRIAQSLGTTSPAITKYLLDLQPGLAVVLAETTGANTIRNVHAPRGIHAHKDASGAWEWMVQDGLGSVRGVVDNSVGVLESRNYDPYGVGFDVTGTSQTVFGFTGEPTDANNLLYLRARYYNPAAGVFTALDPFEGIVSRPMSLNGYSYVHGNPVNLTDPSGQIAVVDDAAAAIAVGVALCPECVILALAGAAIIGTAIVGYLLGKLLLDKINQGCYKTIEVDEDKRTEAAQEFARLLDRDLVPVSSGDPSGDPNDSHEEDQDFDPLPLPQPDKQPQRTRRRGPGGCRTYGAESYFDIGKRAHQEIQIAFRGRFGFGSTRVEMVIPGSGPNGGDGRADAVLLDEGIRWGAIPVNNYAGIYEIKSKGYFYNSAYFQEAVNQRDRYIANFSKSQVGGTAVAGTIWEPHDETVGVWPLDPQQKLNITSYYLTPNAQGLIFYYCQ